MDESIKIFVDNIVRLGKTTEEYIKSLTFLKGAMMIKTSHRPYKKQNKNGQNKKEKKHNKIMLRGRGCREHLGGAPLRGKGRTAHGYRK